MVSLAKVSLDKKGQSVSLSKRPQGYGDIRVNLNWHQAAEKPRGFLASLFADAKPAIDLDLGCLYELQDGSAGAVQALGDAFGSLVRRPYIELSGDDRTGANSDGETMRINGAKWAEIKRILVFAFIYDGAPNWNATDGVVTVEVPGDAPIEVRMTGGRNDRAMCGICLIENVGGEMRVTQAVDYYPGHAELDRDHGWGMRWVAGSKD